MKNFVSIIIPCFNASKYLEDLFLSLDNQTYKFLEIIFVDDGSSDDTLTKIDNYAKKSIYEVKIIKQANLGPSAARNAGLSVSSGDFVYFGDADDIYHPQLIQLLFSTLNQNKCDFIACGKKRINCEYHYKSNYKSYKRPKLMVIDSKTQIVSWLLSMSKFGYEGFNKLYKRNILKKLSSYPNVWDKTCYYGEDLLFNLQYCVNCNNAIYIDKPLYLYRKSPNSITTSGFNTKLLTFKKVINYFYTLDKNSFKECEVYIKTYLCFISADILLKISKSDFNDLVLIQSIYDDFISNWKSCFKAKLAPKYRRYFMWGMIPIVKFALRKKMKK